MRVFLAVQAMVERLDNHLLIQAEVKTWTPVICGCQCEHPFIWAKGEIHSVVDGILP